MGTRMVLPGLLLALSAGCGGGESPVEVSGTVTLDGKDLAEGEIIFLAADNSVTPATGPVRDGRFAFKTLPGPKKVRINASRPTAKPDPVMGAAARESMIPAEYNTQTKLTADVPPGKASEHKFELKSKP